MLDVHILTLDSTNPKYLQQALDSIEVAKSKCSIPVNVFVVEGVPSHLGRSRSKGYSYGTSAYVTHVDHDDWLHEDALLRVEGVIKQQYPQAITTGEYLVGAQLEPHPNDRHHLAVFNREWLEQQDYEQYRFYPDHYLLQLSSPLHISECLYYLRVEHNSASRIQRTKYRTGASREAALIRDKKLMLTENMTYNQIKALMDKEMGDG